MKTKWFNHHPRAAARRNAATLELVRAFD